MTGRSPLKLNIYGVTCLVDDKTSTGAASEHLTRLRQTFEFFSVDQIEHAEVIISVVDSADSNLPGSWRKVSWKDGPEVRFAMTKTGRVAQVTNHKNAPGYIENYLNSAVGEILERRGWFRIHAAGITVGDELEIWHASRGAGKSVRTLRALTKSQASLAGDEMIFFHEGKALPYPLPIATLGEENAVSTEQRTFIGSTKNLHFIPKSRVSLPSANYQVNAVVNTRFIPVAMATWILSVVLGLGLPQMRVYLVRRDTFCWLAWQAFRRLGFALKLIFEGRVRFVSVDELRA